VAEARSTTSAWPPPRRQAGEGLATRWPANNGRHSQRNSGKDKRELSLLLYEHGYSQEYKESLLRFLDWLIKLPEGVEQKLDKEIEALRKEKRMPYITNWERIAEKRGRKQGQLKVVQRLLKKKLGDVDSETKVRVEKLSLTRLAQLAEALLDFTEVADLELWLERKTG
jgi:hypothetical protein